MAQQERNRKLRQQSLEIRKNLLKLCNQKNIHIGGDLSVCDIMTVIWQYAMKYDVNDPKTETRDRFILSKGHAAAVTSFNQALRGCYNVEDIYKEYATDNGRFGMHSCNLINPYVEVSTGSLGHGLPVGTGIAEALRMKGNSKSRVYVVLGDGEMDEGSVWEGFMSARQMKLGNLVAFVDRNGLQFDGPTADVIDLEPFADKLRSFGWNVVEIEDGNDVAALADAVDSLPDPASDIPTIFVCRTVKGKGVDFMENQVSWHAGKLTDEQYEAALLSLKNNYPDVWED